MSMNERTNEQMNEWMNEWMNCWPRRCSSSAIVRYRCHLFLQQLDSVAPLRQYRLRPMVPCDGCDWSTARVVGGVVCRRRHGDKQVLNFVVDCQFFADRRRESCAVIVLSQWETVWGFARLIAVGSIYRGSPLALFCFRRRSDDYC